MQLIRVWSPETEPPVAYVNELGQLVRKRFIARDADGKPLPEGEEVRQTVEVIRDIRRGHLRTTDPLAPQPAAPAPAPVPAPADAAPVVVAPADAAVPAPDSSLEPATPESASPGQE